MSRYLVVAYQTATSPDLVIRATELAAEDPEAEFTLLIPATPAAELVGGDEDDGDPQRRLEQARRLFEAAGLRVVHAAVGASEPLQAIADELRARAGAYDKIVLSTLPQGISRWLRMDIHGQAERRFDLPVISVVSQSPSTHGTPLGRFRVEEWMRRDVETISPDLPLSEALARIASSVYGCFVVVDEAGRPTGIITDGDMIRLTLAEQTPGGAYLRRLLASPEAVLRHLQEMRRTHGQVRDWMTTPLVTVRPDESLQRVAEMFAVSDVHQLPVVRDGELVGLIRSVDLIVPILQAHDELQRE